jgi:hypothetical protein
VAPAEKDPEFKPQCHQKKCHRKPLRILGKKTIRVDLHFNKNDSCGSVKMD